MQECQISEDKARECGFGEFPVIIIPHYSLKLKDGVHLAVKFYFPSDSQIGACDFRSVPSYQVYKPQSPSTAVKFPVILEYLPYNKADWSSPRDFERHTWFCSHGYISARVDMRGTGDSEGLYHDEYLAQEQQDCMEVIDWLSKQDWCNGRIGMYGKSWGGLNGLQIAYEQPPGLKAVISLFSTDDRYETEMYRDNGCIIGNGLFSWATSMLLLNARPPNPDNHKDWKSLWNKRLQNITPWANIWLRHQEKDQYLLHGSISQNYKKIDCPVLAIGGWRDGYTDAVFRMASNLKVCRAIIGPWSHDWPDCAKPGPQCAFLQECLRWFDCHLKCLSNSVMEEVPLMRIYSLDSVKPEPMIEKWPGSWKCLYNWPSDSQIETLSLFPDNQTMSLCQVENTNENSIATSIFDGFEGLNVGSWLSFGLDFPLDQTENNKKSATWTTEQLSEPIGIMGFPEFSCLMTVTGSWKSVGYLAVRICDVRPDGTSTLVTWGCTNLKFQRIVSSEWKYVTVRLRSIAYTIPAGHKLSLSVSPSFWTMLWPTPSATSIHIQTGRDIETKLNIPTDKKAGSLDGIAGEFLLQDPKPRVTLPVTTLKNPTYSQYVTYDDSTNNATVTVEQSFRTKLHDTGTVLGEAHKEVYDIERYKPQSAMVKIRRTYNTEWPHHSEKTRVEVSCKMNGDEENFYTEHELKVYHNEDIFYQKEWKDTIERLYV